MVTSKMTRFDFRDCAARAMIIRILRNAMLKLLANKKLASAWDSLIPGRRGSSGALVGSLGEKVEADGGHLGVMLVWITVLPLVGCLPERAGALLEKCCVVRPTMRSLRLQPISGATLHNSGQRLLRLR